MKKITNKVLQKIRKYISRKHRTNIISKTVTDLPRLIINRSNKNNYAQIIDRSGKVVASFSDIKISEGTKQERAKKVGLELAKLALSKNVEKVVFDRNGYIYHGRVKAIADGAREGGLKF